MRHHEEETADAPRPEHYVVGVDFGTLSGRAVVVRVADGAELASAVHAYAHGVIDRRAARRRTRRCRRTGRCRCPRDYVDVLRTAVPAGGRAGRRRPGRRHRHRHRLHRLHDGAGTLADGTPLCELPEFADRPHAYVKLWKHHAAQPQADRINALAAERGEPWLPRYGGLISAEWEFAKALQLLEEDPEVYAAIDHWVEAADWIVWQLCGALRPQRLHRRLQGHPPGRPLPVAGLPRRAATPASPTSSATSWTTRSAQLGARGRRR